MAVRLLAATEADGTDVLSADGYIFATPENLASMAGLMKDFFDRSYYPALDRINGRPYAMLICAGSDGDNAVRQIRRIVTGWRLRDTTVPVPTDVSPELQKIIAAPRRQSATCWAIISTY